MTISEKIQLLRKAGGMSQEQLAGAAIGYNLHKILSSDNKTLISSQIADTDNLVADFSFSPALGKTDTGRLCQFTVVPKVFVEDTYESIWNNNGR